MNNILTTHVGSLPRPQEVVDIVFAKEEQTDSQQTYSDKDFDTIITKATYEVVAKQKSIGIDIPSDGEMSKLSYATYIKDRLYGFEGDSPRRTPADLVEYQNYAKKIASLGGTPSYKRPQCIDKITVKDWQPLYDDIRRFKQALSASNYSTGFMNAASPGVIALFQPSVYHDTHEAYLYNLAAVMREEYEAIIEAGLYVQIDAPDLALGRHMAFADKSDKAFLQTAQLHIEALNEALKNIPAHKIRLHICWGNYEGPHHHDIPLEKILPTVLQAKPQTLLFEASNPRHAHEYTAFQTIDIPQDYILCPGVIDSTSNFIEHPQLVAQRIQTYIDIVGKERVIAGTDCGFGTFAGFGRVDMDIVWAKLSSLCEGSRLVQ